jgi:DNA-binding LacI/PurR family transcriptional regulator
MAKVTIKDIATRAGVSKTAVSFAFNRPDQLSEETLRNILTVAEELGYNPDPVASNLKTRQIGCIGLLLPQPLPLIARNPLMTRLIEGIGTVCHEEGLSLMLVPPLKGNMRRAIIRAAVDGFLTLGLETFRGAMKVLQERSVPFVMIDGDPEPGIPCVNIDDEAGGYMAMSYILGLGHGRIAILGIRSGQHGDYEHYAGTLRRRMMGYVRALDQAGLAIDNRRIRLIECECDIEGGYEALKTLWSSRWRPTAVITMADVLAFGVLKAAQENGIDVPGDLSVIGNDDVPESVLVYPPLTTIRQPVVDKGGMAARMLIENLGGQQPEMARHVVLPVEFVERASCGVRPRQ